MPRLSRFVLWCRLPACLLSIAPLLGWLLPPQISHAAEAIRSVSVGSNRELRINGQPFFPLMAWLQDPQNFPLLRKTGMNCTAGYWPHSGGTRDVADYLEQVRKSGLFGVMPFDKRLKNHPALLGYIQDDEPDLAPRDLLKGDASKRVRQTPSTTQAYYGAIRQWDPSRPVFLTLTGDFLPFFGKFTDEDRALVYPDYVESSDVVGFDIYPIYGWNKPEWLYLVHDATKRLVQLAGARPVYAWIETSRGGQYTGALENQALVKPEHIRAEVWMAICRGATAIGYFTHVWKPSYKQFGVPPENQKALREINEQITQLAPEILATPSKRNIIALSKNGVRVDVMARETSATLTLFAVNYDPAARETEVEFQMQSAPEGARDVEVVDENRRLPLDEARRFRDHFAALEVHVYRLKL